MDYRKHLKKGECLFNAILWTAIPLLYLFLFFYSSSYLYLDLKNTWYGILLLAVEVIACAVHWYRYLAYDKKRLEENNHE